LPEYRKSIFNFIAKKTVLNMKNKEFYKLLKQSQSNQSNSGFTLIELLVGLLMSIFVIGALGFGLMTVLQTNQRENSKVKARTENSRALDFVSDEVRRARDIETTDINAGSGFSEEKASGYGYTPVLALDLPEISSTANVSVQGRIMYYLKEASDNWKGPQVLYRWGPPLDANGNYTNGAWQEEALIDGINDTTVTSPCTTSGGTVTPATPKGFYACITGTNTAQLFLTGQTKTATGVNDSQTNDTKVVARARTRAANSTDKNNSITWSVKGLGGEFACDGSRAWSMRTDFGNDPTNPNNTTPWLQDPSVTSLARQPQPIPIRTNVPLTISSSAVNRTGCNNDDRGNPGVGNQNNPLNTYANTIQHLINFDNPATFNGDDENGTYNNSMVKGTDEAVQFFKKGHNVPTQYAGYDKNSNGVFDAGDQPSLGKFLYDQGIAIPVSVSGDPNAIGTEFKIPTTRQEIDAFLASPAGLLLDSAKRQKFQLLGDDERIIAVEVGQKFSNTDNSGNPSPNGKNPGFDLQDNIFIVASDVFKTKFESSCFSGTKCSPSTGKPE
jgi:Tfp pilus assembly protein PilW